MRRAKSDTELSRRKEKERQRGLKRHFRYQMYRVKEEAVNMEFSVQNIQCSPIPFTFWRKGKLTLAIKEERSNSYNILMTIPLRTSTCNVKKSWTFQTVRKVDLRLHLEYRDNKRNVHHSIKQIKIDGERETVNFDMITEPNKNQNYQIPKWSFVLFDLNGNTRHVRSQKLSPVPKKNAEVYLVTDTKLLLVKVLELAETIKELEEFKKKWKETDRAKTVSSVEEETTKLPTSEQKIEQSKEAKFEITVKKTCADVRYQNKPQLCKDEIEFLKSRRQKVLEGFRQLPVNIQEEKVPNIAIIGSGGGMRAVIGMGAALDQLQRENILDCAMYVAGLSGSAWYLLTLYAHGKKIDPAAVNSHIQRKVKNKYRIYFRMARKVLTYYIKNLTYYHGEYFSFTNLFGEMIGDLLLDKNCLKKWSDVAVSLDQGCNPLPLVSALNVKVEKTMQNYNEWMEFSPYQVLLPIYGAAIDMTKFGDKFDRGFCTNTYEERPIHFLQGMCGSAYAFARDYRPQGNEWYIPVIVDDKTDIKNSGIWSLFNKFDSSFVAKVPHFLHGVSDIGKQALTDLFFPTYIKPVRGYKDKITRMKKINKPIEQTGLWYKGLRKFKDVILCFAKGFVRVALTSMKVNFGYKDITKGHGEAHDSKMLLVDAGIAFNSPYPSVLHPARGIDIIISFDFSDRGGDTELPFEELKLAEQWARLRDVPFPEIYPTLNTMEENWKKGDQREVYIFSSPGAPTIVHFVMINKSFRLENDSISENFDEIQKTKNLFDEGILYDLVTELDIPENEKTHFYESITERDRKTAVLEMISKRRDSTLKQLVPVLETARIGTLFGELKYWISIENILHIMAKDSVISTDEKRRIIDGCAPDQQEDVLLEIMRKRSDISLKSLIQTVPKRYELSEMSRSTDHDFEKLLQTLPTTNAGTLVKHLDEILKKIGMQEICSLTQDILSEDVKIMMKKIYPDHKKKKAEILTLFKNQQLVIKQHVQTLCEQGLKCIPLELLDSIDFEQANSDDLRQTFDEFLEKIGMQVILCGLKRDDVLSEYEITKIQRSDEHCRNKETLLRILNKHEKIAVPQLVKTLQKYKCEYVALQLMASPDFENKDYVIEIFDEILKHLNFKDVLNKLESHTVISGYEKCRIDQCRTNDEKKKALIKIIIKRSDHALECLIPISQKDNLKEIFKKILKQFGISKIVNAIGLLISVDDQSCIKEYSFNDKQRQTIPSSMISVEAWKQLLNTLPKNSISQILDEMFETGNKYQMLYDLVDGTLLCTSEARYIKECKTQLEMKNALLKYILHTRDPNQFLKKLNDTDGAPNNFDILPNYGTLRFSYSEEEFYKFNTLVRHNVKNNMSEIIKCIKQKIV